MLEEFQGVPTRPLLVHSAVVLVPLLVLAPTRTDAPLRPLQGLARFRTPEPVRRCRRG